MTRLDRSYVLQPGDVIWRRLRVNAMRGLYADAPLFPLTKDGISYVIRANTTYAPVSNNNDLFVHPSEGALCFCPYTIYDDYTHFVVEASMDDAQCALVVPKYGELTMLADRYIWQKYCPPNANNLKRMFGAYQYHLFETSYYRNSLVVR